MVKIKTDNIMHHIITGAKYEFAKVELTDAEKQLKKERELGLDKEGRTEYYRQANHLGEFELRAKDEVIKPVRDESCDGYVFSKTFMDEYNKLMEFEKLKDAYELAMAELNDKHLNDYRKYQLDTYYKMLENDKAPANYIIDMPHTEPIFESRWVRRRKAKKARRRIAVNMMNANTTCRKISLGKYLTACDAHLYKSHLTLPTILTDSYTYGNEAYNDSIKAAKKDMAAMDRAVSVQSEVYRTDKKLMTLNSSNKGIIELVNRYVETREDWETYDGATVADCLLWVDCYLNNFIKKLGKDENGKTTTCYDDKPDFACVKAFLQYLRYEYCRYSLMEDGCDIRYIFVPADSCKQFIVDELDLLYNPDVMVVLVYKYSSEYEFLSVSEYADYLEFKEYQHSELLPFYEEVAAGCELKNQMDFWRVYRSTHDVYDAIDSMLTKSEATDERMLNQMNKYYEETEGYNRDTDTYYSKASGDLSGTSRYKLLRDNRMSAYAFKQLNNMFTVHLTRAIVERREKDPEYPMPKYWDNGVVTHPWLDVDRREGVFGDCGLRLDHKIGTATYSCPKYNRHLVDLSEIRMNGNVEYYICPVCGHVHYIFYYPADVEAYTTVCEDCKATLDFVKDISDDIVDPRDSNPNWKASESDPEDDTNEVSVGVTCDPDDVKIVSTNNRHAKTIVRKGRKKVCISFNMSNMS